MTVQQLAKTFGYKALCMPDENREVVGCYAGDLLSWVMGRLEADNAWVTIMSNVNVIAVATLSDPSCVILSEGVELDEEVLIRARQQGINVLTTDKTTFLVCADLATL